MVHVETRLPPQAGIDGRWRLLFLQERVRLEAPNHPALRRGDFGVLDGAKEAARRFGERAIIDEVEVHAVEIHPIRWRGEMERIVLACRIEAVLGRRGRGPGHH